MVSCRVLLSPIGVSLALLLFWPLGCLKLVEPPSTHAQTYGPANEPCGTAGTVLNTGSDWRTQIGAGAPGTTFRLQAGTYNFGVQSTGLTIPPGVDVKPYNCADVVLTGTSPTAHTGSILSMGANSTLAGLRVEANTTGSRHAQMLTCNTDGITMRNNRLFGGTGDALRTQSGSSGCQGWRIEGNDINGSSAEPQNGGHNILINGGGGVPRNISILRNRIASTYFPEEQRADDVITVEAGCDILIEGNLFPTASAKNKENIVDIKSRDSSHCNAGVVFQRNTIENAVYTGTVGGQDGGGSYNPYFTIHDKYGSASQIKHVFEYNYWGGCPTRTGLAGTAGGGCFALATSDEYSSLIMRYNVFNLPTATGNTEAQRIHIGSRTVDITFEHNTIIGGVFRLRQKFAPGTHLYKNNIFYDVYVLDEHTSAGNYVNSHNVHFSENGPGWNYADGNNLTVDPGFANMAGKDFNPTTASVINSGSDGQTRGALQELAFLGGAVSGNAAVLTLGTKGKLPFSSCTPGLFDVEVLGVNLTATGCVPGPQSNEVSLTLATAAGPGAATAKWSYGAVSDSQQIGGPATALQSKMKAQPVAQSLANEGTVGQPGWVAGPQHARPTGTNQVLVIPACWEKDAITVPMNISNLRYGGQLCTEAASVDQPDGALGVTGQLSELWYCNHDALNAATSSLITFDTSEPPDAGKPVVLASAFYDGINQTTPLVPPAVSAGLSGTSITTAPLNTVSPGIAIATGCAGTATAWGGGPGWTVQLNQGEDATPTARLLVQDRTTTGSAVTPSADNAGGTRLTMTAIALNGGTQPSPTVPVYTQTATRCAMHNEPLFAWQPALDGRCAVMPGHHVLGVFQIKVTGNGETSGTSKPVECCDAASCQDDDWYLVGTPEAGRAVAYGSSSFLETGESIACPFPDLSNPGGACVPGLLFESATVEPSQLAVNTFTQHGHVLQINQATTATTVQCRLVKENAVPFDAYSSVLTLTLVPGFVFGP